MRATLFLLGLGVALVPTFLRAYLLSPAPGSQSLESMAWVYRLSHLVPPAQVVGALLALCGLVALLRRRRGWRTLIEVGPALGTALAVYGLSWWMSAPRMFRPNLEPTFARGTSEELPAGTLVLALRSGEMAKAYPLRLLAYHHQVRDELAGEPLWVTYCTMCRSGKIFRPIVDGREASFELIGAVHYNSIYRDSVSGSFWYQANGRAAAGPAAGSTLPELRAEQMTLGRWLALYPESEVLQPHPDHADGYRLFAFDQLDSKRSNPDKAPGFRWVVGVVHDGAARGWAWSMLAGDRLHQDRIGEVPIAIHLLADGFSHRVWDRRLGGRVLDLRLDGESDRLFDDVSGSWFGFDGVAVGGELAGRRLTAMTSTVELRHSFERFSGGEIDDP